MSNKHEETNNEDNLVVHTESGKKLTSDYLIMCVSLIRYI